jgi:hypothetical protein
MASRLSLPYLSDANWERLENALSRFGDLSELIQEQCDSPFDLGTVIPELESSYKENGYQYLFYSLVRLLKPEKIIEIGVLQGFSLLSMACGLKDNDNGSIEGYDLFDNYEFKNDRMVNVLSRIANSNLQKFASVYQCDAYKVLEKVKCTDILHIDISNTGDVIERMFSSWKDKLTDIIIFEGGGEERDNVNWMREYNKFPLVPILKKLEQLYDDWEFITLGNYPSITVCLKTAR